MRAFSQLLDDLVYTRSRLTKLRLIGDYLKETPDPDRGLALAALRFRLLGPGQEFVQSAPKPNTHSWLRSPWLWGGLFVGVAVAALLIVQQ